MLRFILRTKFRDGYNGQEGENLETLDLDVPELEATLRSGGFSENSYQATQLLGVELLRELRFQQTSCSSCGRTFGPGDSGFSHCSDHGG